METLVSLDGAEKEKSPVADPKATTTTEQSANGWIDLGPGPGKLEVLRCRKLGTGWLVASIAIRKGYSHKAAASGNDEVIETDAITRSMVFTEHDPRSASASAPQTLTETCGPKM